MVERSNLQIILGYNLVKRIPEGATNIAIRQHSAEDNKEDQNYLGINLLQAPL